MATDDEEFLRIFEDNNLEELLSESENVKVTIKDLQEGLTNLIQVAAYISEFIVEFFSAYEEDGSDENTPKMKDDIVFGLLNIFHSSESLIDLFDVECDEDDDD